MRQTRGVMRRILHFVRVAGNHFRIWKTPLPVENPKIKSRPAISSTSSRAGFRQKNSSPAEIQCSLDYKVKIHMATVKFSDCYVTHRKLDADTPLMSECTTSYMLGSLLFIIMGLLMPPPCSNSVTSVSR